MAVPGTNTNVLSARDVVSVACKLPNGVLLRGMRHSVETEPVQGGGLRDVEYYRPTEDVVHIEGTGHIFGQAPPILIKGGYRITRNVPKLLWDDWFKANKDGDLVKRGLIYASDKEDDLKAHAREHETERTGLEGIDPQNPGRYAKGITRADKPK